MHRSKKILKLRVTGLCEGNWPVTGELPAQMANNAENVSIWWRHHERHIKCINFLAAVGQKTTWPGYLQNVMWIWLLTRKTNICNDITEWHPARHRIFNFHDDDTSLTDTYIPLTSWCFYFIILASFPKSVLQKLLMNTTIQQSNLLLSKDIWKL